MSPTAKSRPTMKWKPAPPGLVRTFQEAVQDLPGAEIRKMFGYPAAFVNGNMLGGLFQDTMMLRLSPNDLADARDRTGAKPFEPMKGRVMREYIVVPEEIVESRAEIGSWLRKSLAYTKSLPAKAPAGKSKKRSR